MKNYQYLLLVWFVALLLAGCQDEVGGTINTPGPNIVTAPTVSIIQLLSPVSYWASASNLTDIMGRNNGKNSFVPDSATLDQQQYSIMVKFNPDTNKPTDQNQTLYQRIIEKGGYQSTYGGGWSVEWATNGVAPGYNNVACLMWDTLIGGYSRVQSRLSVAMPGQLAAGNIIVCTFDGNTHRMYLNAALIASEAATMVSNTDPVGIGVASVTTENNGYRFSGTINDTAYWDRAISQSEINSLGSAQ